MSILWSLRLRREAASVPFVRRLLVDAMETAGVDSDVSHDLAVAVSEACANAVAHGGSATRAGASGAYRVTAYLDDRTCRIEVEDSGPGFPAGPPRALGHRPSSYPAEQGRGLGLIRQLADHVHIGNRPGRAGAVVSFDKSLKWRDDTPHAAV